MYRISILAGCVMVLSWTGGCATQKESFTARTGTEQMLISSAVDKSLDNLNFTPLRDKQVFLETKYLDCVDKNYIILALRDRIMMVGAQMLDKADKADIIVEVASGGVGTDGQFLFFGIPEIPLPGMIAPVAIPKVAFLERNKMNGTAKLLVLAYDARTKQPLLPTGLSLARTDLKNWNVLGMGNVQTGTLPTEIAATTKEKEFSAGTGYNYLTGAYQATPPRNYATGGNQAVQFTPVFVTPGNGNNIPAGGVIVSPSPASGGPPMPSSGYGNSVLPPSYPSPASAGYGDVK